MLHERFEAFQALHLVLASEVMIFCNLVLQLHVLVDEQRIVVAALAYELLRLQALLDQQSIPLAHELMMLLHLDHFLQLNGDVRQSHLLLFEFQIHTLFQTIERLPLFGGVGGRRLWLHGQQIAQFADVAVD